MKRKKTAEGVDVRPSEMQANTTVHRPYKKWDKDEARQKKLNLVAIDKLLETN